MSGDCKKRGFLDESTAKFTLEKIRKVSKKKVLPKRVYKCIRCDKWHLTSKTDIVELEKENEELKKELNKTTKELNAVRKERNEFFDELRDLRSLLM